MDKPENTELETEHQADNQTAPVAQDFNQAFADLDAIDTVESGAPDEPETELEDQPEALDPSAAVGFVDMGLFMSEQYISGASGVDFAFDETARAKFLEACAPLIGKYGLTWLKWFDAYKEEIMFGVATVGLGYSSINIIKRLQTEQLMKAQAEAANDGKESETAAA